MVDQLHPHVHVKPCRRGGEEAVGVGCDVEFADGGDEGWFDTLGVEGAEIDAYQDWSIGLRSNFGGCLLDMESVREREGIRGIFLQRSTGMCMRKKTR